LKQGIFFSFLKTGPWTHDVSVKKTED